MTEEEKNTNQKVEEEEKDEEKSEFTVEMPEANRVVMEPEVFKEQPDYLKVFANFYIAQFDQDDLEIINLYDNSHNMVDINKYLLNNIHFPRKTLLMLFNTMTTTSRLFLMKLLRMKISIQLL